MPLVHCDAAQSILVAGIPCLTTLDAQLLIQSETRSTYRDALTLNRVVFISHLPYFVRCTRTTRNVAMKLSTLSPFNRRSMKSVTSPCSTRAAVSVLVGTRNDRDDGVHSGRTRKGELAVPIEVPISWCRLGCLEGHAWTRDGSGELYILEIGFATHRRRCRRATSLLNATLVASSWWYRFMTTRDWGCG